MQNICVIGLGIQLGLVLREKRKINLFLFLCTNCEIFHKVKQIDSWNLKPNKPREIDLFSCCWCERKRRFQDFLNLGVSGPEDEGEFRSCCGVPRRKTHPIAEVILGAITAKFRDPRVSLTRPQNLALRGF